MSEADDLIYFNAVLRPNSPMSPRVRRCIVAAAAATNAIFAGFFVLRGTWPLTPFMGTDVLLLTWVLDTSGKVAKCREEMRLTRSLLRVDYFPASGYPTHTELNPYWVRVYVDESVQSRGAISLTSHGHLLRIGSLFSWRERLSLAKALRFALERARQSA